MSLNEFEIICKIGHGSFSEVYKVLRYKDNQIYALKRVRMSLLKEKEKENALNEVRILASLNYKYVIGYKEAFIDDNTNTLCIVMEFAEGGDIQHAIKNHQKHTTFYPEEQIWKALIQITYGLKSLHDQKILHRDLKCANIFFTQDVYKLGDLNVSKIAKRGLVYTQTGTPYYASPEIWRDEPYDFKSDIWSLGCVIYEMTALQPPFKANNMAGQNFNNITYQGLFLKIQKGVYAQIPPRYSYGLQQVIAQMLRMNPSQRPSCEQILTNPHVQANAFPYYEKKQENTKIHLLQTIKLPKNLKGLNSQLPTKNYIFDDSYKISKQPYDLRILRQRKVSIVSIDQKSCIFNEFEQPSSHQLVKQIIKQNQLLRLPSFKEGPPIFDDQKRIQRISSVREDTIVHSIIPKPPFNRPISNTNKHQKGLSHYVKMEDPVQQLSDKERRLIQPLQKQFSEQTPLKKSPQQVLNNLPYLGDFPTSHLRHKSEKENLENNKNRKISPYERPKVVLPISSPFQLERKKKTKLPPQDILNISEQMNDNYFFN